MANQLGTVENFIVLMNIAWTYLLRAQYRHTRVEYRYYRGTAKALPTRESTARAPDAQPAVAAAGAR